MSKATLIGYLARGAPGYVGGDPAKSPEIALRKFFDFHRDEQRAVLVAVYQKPRGGMLTRDFCAYTRAELNAALAKLGKEPV